MPLRGVTIGDCG